MKAILINTAFILIIISILLFIFITIKFLIGKNKTVQKKLKEKEKESLRFLREIKKLREKSNPTQQDLESLNNLARNFFKEKYNLGKNLTYSELSKKFQKNKKTNEISFCNLIQILNYTDKKETSKEIKKAINLLSRIIKSN